jgi:YidC/Oxa1 family membrane protein insertase
MGDQGVQEITYKTMDDKKQQQFSVTNAWMGITDKYWAAALLPDTDAHVQADFSSDANGGLRKYQTGYLLDQQTIAPGATGSANARLFAGAKEVGVVGINFPLVGVDGYNRQLGLNKFDLLIDWGHLYFITKPMFLLLDGIYRFIGNFGVAILAVMVLLKLLFFPLANKSYASMAKMKAVQPHLQALRERFPDDKVKQQQEMMEIYKREKINPLAGCLPIVIQIPVFFALYKVLLVTIEMRHAPFFGWIHDLSSPDPTNVFNLFGLLPFEPSHLPVVGAFLVLGAWPLIMGVTMWVQMKLNPAPPDPAQKMMFDWMPVIFTFMLSSFSSGLVIYWAWNNTLSVIQQSVIMRRNGAKIELFDNLRDTFKGLRDLFKKKSSANMSGPA